MDEYFVTSGTRLFDQGSAIAQRFGRIYEEIRGAVAGTTDDDALSADPDTWAKGLADERMVDPPHVDVGRSELVEEGPVKVNCTDVPGVSHFTSEYGQVIRDGVRFRLSVPGKGELGLLSSRLPAGGPGVLADIEPARVVRTWEWPEVKGAPEFEGEVQRFLNTLQNGAEALAGDVARRNADVVTFARAEIDKRRADILKRRDFLGQITIPVRRSDDVPADFGPPPVRPKATPTRPRQVGTAPASAASQQPHLDEFYNHILEVIRAEARGLERSPGSFAGAGEETLRDHIVVTLNTHYMGQTYAEAFNRAGKTDILIRVHDRNAFIGECKWWSGPAGLDDALNQLFSYTTWQDSKVALIFFVKAKGITDVIRTAKSKLAARPEFISWTPSSEDGELRCRVRWPDDKERQATLTALFVHLASA